MRAEALAKRVLGHQLLELTHQLPMPAQRKIRRHPVLEHRQAQLLQPRDRRLRERLVREVGQRVSPPEGQRLTQRVRRRGRLVPDKRSPALVGQLLESLQVELAFPHFDPVAGRLRDDPAVLARHP